MGRLLRTAHYGLCYLEYCIFDLHDIIEDGKDFIAIVCIFQEK